jgi:pilus assembly protein CpaE
VVLLDVATSVDQAGDLIRFLTELKPPIHVVGLHTQNDPEAILRTLRLGATEFLYAPFEVSVQEAAVSRICRLLQPDQQTERELGKVIIFSSTKPGSGASTLAAQTAFAIRRASGKRVLLADFDLAGGTIGFYLKLEQEYSLVDLLSHSDQMNTDLWASMVSNTNGIDVLPAPEIPNSDAIEQSQVHDVLNYARMLYDWVIVDLPSIFHRISLLSLSESDRAFLVSTSELASLHLARKAVKLLAHLGFDSHRYQVLINRIDKQRDSLGGSDLSKLFNCPVGTSLPNDYFSLHRVVTLGTPLDSDTELGRAIEGLAGKLMGVTTVEKRKTSRFALTRPLLTES